LFILAGWRWAGALAAAPIQVADVHQPTVVLVAQPGDCPDRRAAMSAWLSLALAEAPRADLQLSLAMLRGGAPPTGPPLAELPALSEKEMSRAERALLRAGVTATPALLLLDAGGVPVMGAAFTETGLEARLVQAVQSLAALMPVGEPPSH